jgi:elongation factor P
MKINANDIRVGNLLEHEKRLWLVLKTMHTQPGKGGAYMQVEMKDIQSSTKSNVRFRSAETVTKVRLDQRDFQFLYDEGDTVALMDKETFEQMSLNKDIFGDKIAYLMDGMDVTVEFYNDNPISALLPETVQLRIADCEPAIKGQTAASSFKPAKLENGVRIMVPPFISIDDVVVVRTADGQYMERAK